MSTSSMPLHDSYESTAMPPMNRPLLSLLSALIILLSGCAAAPRTSSRGAGVDAKLKALGITLPTPAKPVANYVPTVRTGDLVFLSGHGPRRAEGGYVTGKVPSKVSLEEARKAARLTAISLLASLRAEIGDLNRVKRIVRVFGMVNSDTGFTDHPAVINGCSDLLVAVFGDRGRHTRAAVGMAALPMGITVEISMIVEVE